MKSKLKPYGKRLRLSKAEEDLIHEFRAKHIENINDNTALNLHLKERGIEKDDVVSVKHWQSANGEYRFSIVTKENLGVKEKEIFKKVNRFISEYSPKYPPIKRNGQNNDPSSTSNQPC